LNYFRNHGNCESKYGEFCFRGKYFEEQISYGEKEKVVLQKELDKERKF
jgi:hypothetical protein